MPGLDTADPDDVGAAVRGLFDIGPFFSVTTGPVTEPGWSPVQVLFEDGSALRGLVNRLSGRLVVDEPRVAASILFQGYAARIWSVSLGALLTHGLVPDLDPADLLWKDDRGSVTLHLERLRGWADGDLVALVAHAVATTHLAPFVDAVRRQWQISPQLLWENAASALLGTARVLEAHTGRSTSVVVQHLLTYLVSTWQLPVSLGQDGRRTSCCLYYRVPGGGVCGDCPFDTPPSARKGRP